MTGKCWVLVTDVLRLKLQRKVESSACSKGSNYRVLLGLTLGSLCFRKLEKGTLWGRRIVAGWDRIENCLEEMRPVMWRRRKK